MNISNGEQLLLNENQANRLIRLFGHPLDHSVQAVAKPVLDEPWREAAIVWHPTLTDLHEQVVHRLNPVLIHTRVLPGDSSPTLSLTLLELPSATVANHMDGRPLVGNQVEQLLTTKPTL